MKILSTLLFFMLISCSVVFLFLISCSAIIKDEDEIEKIFNDVIDEEIDQSYRHSENTSYFS